MLANMQFDDLTLLYWALMDFLKIQKDILLKIEKKASFTKAKNILDLIVSNLRSKKDFRSIRFIIDVDPL